MAYGGWVQWTRPAAGPAQYARLQHALARVSISPTEFVGDSDHAAGGDAAETRPDRRPHAARRRTLAGMAGRLADQGRDVVLLALRTDEIREAAAPRRATHGLVRRLWLLEREERLRTPWPPRPRRQLVAGVSARGGADRDPVPDRDKPDVMVTAVGLAACLLMVVLPAAVCPDVPVLAAGLTAALAGAAGLFLAAPARAVAGAIAALLLAPDGNATMQAVLMGIALLALLDATSYRRRFRRRTIDPSVTRAHLASLGVSLAASIAVVALLAALATAPAAGVDAAARPVAAAAGAILVMAAVLRATRPAADPPAD